MFLIGSYIAITTETSLVDRFSEIAITTRLNLDLDIVYMKYKECVNLLNARN